MISAFARAILREFAESFPESAHYRGGRRLRKAGWEAIFPKIAGDVEAKEAFLESVEELCALGVLEVKWQRFRPGTEVEALYLSDPKLLFTLLDRRDPSDVRLEMLDVLRSDAWNESREDSVGVEFLVPVRTHLQALLEARHPVSVRSADELRDLGRLFRVSPEQAETFPIRALSIRLFGDSKRLEQLLRTADQITEKVVGASFSVERGLSRSYPEVAVSLLGSIALSSGALLSRGEIVSLPAETVQSIRQVKLEGSAVLSVENKESFYILARHLRRGKLPSRFAAVTYCGGYPSESYGALLGRLAQAGAVLYHFGDLDTDGLFILQEIERVAAQSVSPLGMTASLYRRFMRHGVKLPEVRVDRLRAARDTLPSSLQELVGLILEHHLGVEQEVIGVKELFEEGWPSQSPTDPATC